VKYIGITQSVNIDHDRGVRTDTLDQRWVAFIRACGLTPLLLPNDRTAVQQLTAALPIAGILLTGGNTLAAYGGDAPERDEMEFWLVEEAARGGIPILGVCRGMQVIQHLHGVPLCRVSGHVEPRQVITVDGAEQTVNSYHNWGTTETRRPLDVWAVAADGVVKAVRHGPGLLAVMWHPERLEPFRTRDLTMFRDHFEGGR